MDDTQSVSVIVPVAQESRYLGECLRSIHDQTQGVAEILCVICEGVSMPEAD